MRDLKKKSIVIISIILVVLLQTPFPNPFASEQGLKKAEELLKSKKYLEARALFHGIYINTKKGHLADKALLGVGKSDYFLKRYYESRQNLRLLLRANQDPAITNEANYYLGLCALSLYNYKSAEKYLGNVTGPLKNDATVALAEALLRSNDITRAEIMIKTLKADELLINPRGIAVKAMIDSLRGRHESAVSAITKLKDDLLAELDMTVEKGQILYYADMLKEAEAQLKAVVNGHDVSNTNKLRALRVLWYIYNKEEKTEEAIKIGNSMLAFEHSDEFKVNLAKLYDKKGDVKNSLQVLTYIDNKRLKGSEIEKRLRAALNKNDPAITSYIRRYASYVSQDSLLLVDMAKALVKDNDKKTAIEMLKRASKGNASGAASLYLAELLLEEKRFAEAKKALDYLSLDPRYASNASVMLGEILEKEGNTDRAIFYYKKIVDVNKDPKIANRLGDLLWKTGKRADAVKYYILASNSGNEVSSIKAGDFFYLKGEKKRAEEFYKKALGINKDKPEYIWLNYQYGKLTGNKEYLSKAASGTGEIADAAKILMGQF